MRSSLAQFRTMRTLSITLSSWSNSSSESASDSGLLESGPRDLDGDVVLSNFQLDLSLLSTSETYEQRQIIAGRLE
jgi:hypothetical protein